MLLATGYAIGAPLGFISGVAIGWSRAVGYWVHPVLRFIGPLARDRLAAAGVLRVSVELERQRVSDRAGHRVSRHGTDLVRRRQRQRRLLRRRPNARRPPGFLILKVAIPAAMPSVFVGLFMGLGASFAVLVVAEMMGVKAGLGWYLSGPRAGPPMPTCMRR